MNISEKNKLAKGMLEKLRSFFRPIFDNGSSQTMVEREFDKNLKPNFIRIKK